MFDIGWSELLVIAIVAIVVVGPKDLPRMMRTFGRYAGKLRRAASDFQRQFEDAMRESELDEMRKNWEAAQSAIKAPVDKPLMLPEPKAEATASEASPKPAAEAKPKRKPRTKTAAAKAKPAANVSAAAEPVPAKRTPRPRKRPAKAKAAKPEPEA